MPYCSSCGSKVEAGAKFCENCGSPLEQKQVKGREETEELNYVDEVTEENDKALLSQNKQEEKSNILINKKRRIAILAVIGIVLIALIVGLFGRNLYIRHNPVSWALYSLQKNYASDTIHSTTDIKVKFTKVPNDRESKRIKSIAEDFVVRIDNKYSKKEDVILLDLAFLYREQNIISGNIYADKDLIAVNFPELYDKPLYLKWEDIDVLLLENLGLDMIIKDYKSVSALNESKYFDNIKKDYYTFFVDNLSNNFKKGGSSQVIVEDQNKSSSVNCKELIMNMDNTELSKLTQNLFNKIAEDKKLKEFVEQKLDEFLSIAQKNGDLEKTFGEGTNISAVKREFDEEYDNYMKELRDANKDINIDKDNTSNIKYVYKIDSKNYVREIQEEVETKLDSQTEAKVISDTIFNTIGGKIDIEKINLKNTINIVGLSESQKEDILSKVSRRLEDIISSNFDF